MNQLLKYGLIAVAVGGYFLYQNLNSDTTSVEEEIDLNVVLDITLDSIYKFEDTLTGEVNLDSDNAFVDFAKVLQTDYNAAQPALYTTPIGVSPQADASLLAYADGNANSVKDEGEQAMFMIEVDGENSRIIASSRTGAVNDHHFSGTSLLAGYLLGSMLSRQRAAGVNSKSLANKKPVTAKAAARSRAGSGSHSKGK